MVSFSLFMATTWLQYYSVLGSGQTDITNQSWHSLPTSPGPFSRQYYQEELV